jgi:hypothetical protein
VCQEGDLFKICLLLHQAEEMVGGMVKARQRAMAIMWTALHLHHIGTMADLSLRSQWMAFAGGDGVKNGGASASTFWQLSDWGLMAQARLEANPIVGFMAI